MHYQESAGLAVADAPTSPDAAASRPAANWYKLVFAGLILSSLLVRLVFVVFFMEHDKYYWEDTIHYYSAAESMFETGSFGFDPERAAAGKQLSYGLEPAYPLFLVPWIWVFGKGYLGIRIVQSLILCLSGIPFFLMLKRLVRDEFALMGTALYLFYPFYVFFSGIITPEAIYPPLLICYVLCTLLYFTDRKPAPLYVSVALLAILGHVKVTSWSLGLVTAVVFLWRSPFPSRKFAVRAVVSFFIFLLVCLPWGIRNYRLHGRIALPRNYSTEPGGSELQKKLSARSGTLQYAGNLFSPGLTKVDSRNKWNHPIYQWVSVACVTPLLIATVLLPFFKRSWPILILYIVFFSYCLPYIVLGGQTRYRLPIDFVMIVFLTILVETVWERLNAVAPARAKTPREAGA